MRDNLTRSLGGLHKSFSAFTAGQKVVAVLGTVALLLAGFMVFRWASAPTYTPLFSNLAPSDASAIIDKLNADGTKYQITDGGSTILVPQEKVYAERIALSGEGIPSSSGQSGYSILDDQNLSTSQFQEQTDFKRAMEGELATTIEAIDGVETAVVHLAIPPKEVFADEQEPTTASVLVKTRVGTTLNAEQVQAVVNLVSSSIDGLDPENVTIADSTGKVLSAPGGAAGTGGASTQAQQVADFQNQKTSQIQTMLDRVLGTGNSTVQVTPVLNFDKTVTETTRYFGRPVAASLAESEETFNGPNGGGVTGGVVGPDGQMDPTTATGNTDGAYDNTERTVDNLVNSTVEHREAAPGGVESLHVGVVLDTQALKGINPQDVEELVSSTLGIDPDRGDTVNVSSMPFDRAAEEAAAQELEATAAAEKKAQTMGMVRNGGLAGLVGLILLVAWLSARKRNKQRMQAATYVVEQLRRDAAERQPAPAPLETNPAMLALESQEKDMTAEVRDEIAALVERQPEDVAALLRGWLVDRA